MLHAIFFRPPEWCLENPQNFLPCIFFKKPSFIHLTADKLCCDVSVYVVSIASGYIMGHDMTNAAQHESPVMTALCSEKNHFASPLECFFSYCCFICPKDAILSNLTFIV